MIIFSEPFTFAPKHDLYHRPADASYDVADGSNVTEVHQKKGLQRVLVRPPAVPTFYGTVSDSSVEVRRFGSLVVYYQ